MKEAKHPGKILSSEKQEIKFRTLSVRKFQISDIEVQEEQGFLLLTANYRKAGIYK